MWQPDLRRRLHLQRESFGVGDSQDLAGMNARQRLQYRRQTVGFIWQQTSRNLLSYLTSEQNVELPMRLAGASRRERAALDAARLCT